MRHLIFAFLMTLMVFTMLIGAASCTNKIAKAKDTFDQNKKEAAEYCAEKFPVKELYLPGEEITHYDTLWGLIVKDDTVILETKDTVLITVTKTLPAKTIVKTVRVVDTVLKENTAKSDYLLLDIKSKDEKIAVLEADRDNWKSKAKQRFWWLLILIGAAGAYTFLKLKKIL